MESPTATSATPAAAAPLWEDFVDVLYAPTQVFERRRDGRFGVALVVLTVLAAALFFVFRSAFEPVFDAQLEQGMRASAQGAAPTADQLEGARRVAGVFTAIFGVVGTPIVVVIVGLLLWLAGKMFGSVATFGQAMMVSTYANVPRILTTVIVGALATFADPSTLTTTAALTLSPARFLPPDSSPILLALLSRLDVTVIWVTVLLGIGLSVVGRIPRSKAFTAAAVVWLAATVFAFLGALRQAAATG